MTAVSSATNQRYAPYANSGYMSNANRPMPGAATAALGTGEYEHNVQTPVPRPEAHNISAISTNNNSVYSNRTNTRTYQSGYQGGY